MVFIAKEVLRNVKITVNGTDLSDHCSSVTVNDTADEVEFTSFGAGYREFGQGLKTASIDASFFNDFATGSVIATVEPMYQNDAAGTIKVWPTSSGTIVYTLVGKPYQKPSLAGAIGDASTIDITFANAGTAGITRGTA